jgi:hypothetical protein
MPNLEIIEIWECDVIDALKSNRELKKKYT